MASNKEKCEKLRILTISLEGLQNTMTETIEMILTFLKDYEVIMLQETHVGAESNPLFTGVLELSLSDTNRKDKLQIKRIKGSTAITTDNFRFHKDITFYLTHFSSNKKGVGIIINAKHAVSQRFYNDGTYIGVRTNIDGKEYTFVSVYYHSKDNDVLLQQCYQDIQENSQGSVLVIGGDFNVTLSELDVKEDKAHRWKRRSMFREIWMYSDVWRSKHNARREYTFKSHWEISSGEKQESRLDYFFMKDDQISLVETCEIQGQIDLFQHKPVSLTIKHTEPDGLDSSKPHDPPESSSSQPSNPKPRLKTEPKSECESDHEQITEGVKGIQITDDSQ